MVLGALRVYILNGTNILTKVNQGNSVIYVCSHDASNMTKTKYTVKQKVHPYQT